MKKKQKKTYKIKKNCNTPRTVGRHAPNGPSPREGRPRGGDGGGGLHLDGGGGAVRREAGQAPREERHCSHQRH